MSGSARSAFDELPRCGWVAAATPIMPLDEMAARLGLASLHVKRDDELDVLFGGTKPRKLDYLLAEPLYRDTETWHGIGAIGSGQLVALIEAGRELGHPVVAHCFAEPTSPEVLENLAFIASHAAALDYHPGIWSMIMRHPSLYVGKMHRGGAVVPPGSTTTIGMLGTVRAGLELADQVRDDELPEPDVLLVAVGSAGTAVGLSVGLALAGLKTRIVGVATVPRLLLPASRLSLLQSNLVNHLRRAGVECPDPKPIELDRDQLGEGYGYPTSEGRAATAELVELGLHLEPVYTAKAFASLWRPSAADWGHVLYWHTARRGELPTKPDWKASLPPALLEHIEGGRRRSRRAFVAGTAATTGVLALSAFRFRNYQEPPNFEGLSLAHGECHVLAGAAQAVVPGISDADAFEIANNVDRYATTLSHESRVDIHSLLAVVEHGVPLLVGYGRRFTALDLGERAQCLDRLAELGHPYDAVYVGLRDLCMVGHYQRQVALETVGFHGPLIERGASPVERADYGSLVAAPGTLPGRPK